MINPSTNLLFQDIYAYLSREVQKLVGRDNYEEAFVSWLLSNQFENQDSVRVTKQAIERFTKTNSYQDLAAVGFVTTIGSFNTSYNQLLKSGLDRISGREPMMNDVPVSFTSDVIAILGIILGATYLDDAEILSKVRDWVIKFSEITLKNRGLEDWQKCLFIAVQRKLGLEIVTEYQTPQTLDISVALRSVNLQPFPDQNKAEEDEAEALLLLKRSFNSSNLIRAAFQLRAFNWINRSTPTITFNRISVNQVGDFLRRVSASFRRWPWEDKPRTPNSHAQKWNIENEYHVQSLLYAILAPIFPDLKDEEYTPPVGPKRPRADLTIPSLKLIIEVKYMYSTTTPQKMVEQIAEDSSFYLVEGSNYSQIVAFIWDSSTKLENHDTMVQGMKQIRGVVDAVVVSRPGFMTNTNLVKADE